MIIIEQMIQLLDPNLREFLDAHEACDQYCKSIRNEFYDNNRHVDILALNIEHIYNYSKFQTSTFTHPDCITKAFNWGRSPHQDIDWNSLHLQYGRYVERLPSSARLNSSNRVPLSSINQSNARTPTDVEKTVYTEKDKNNISKLIKTVTDAKLLNTTDELTYLLGSFSKINPSVIDIKHKKQLKTYLLDLYFKIIQTHHEYTN